MEQTSSRSIRERTLRVLDQISETINVSGRDPGSVHLVVVTKSQPLEVVKMAIEAGATILGENYAEDAVVKIVALQESAVEWHMIGHVQSRKADLVAGHFSMIHSLDSVKLGRQLDRFSGEAGRIMPALLEVNVSGEESKYGFPAWEEHRWSDLGSSIEQLMVLPNLRLCGLMTMPPYFKNPEQTRPFFQCVRRLQDHLMKYYPQSGWTELSMGTSSDYLVAIEEGATYVRIGQAILGSRST